MDSVEEQLAKLQFEVNKRPQIAEQIETWITRGWSTDDNQIDLLAAAAKDKAEKAAIK